jgi:hypothetical protein
MKIKYIFIILLSLIGFVGCSKDQNSTPKPKTSAAIAVPVNFPTDGDWQRHT